MLWKISSDKGTEGYLVGSIHIVKPDLYPLAEVYQEVFEKSDILGFEINLDSAQVKAQTLLPKLGFYSQDDNLKAHLSEETYQKVSQTSKSLGLPMASVDRMKPWLVAITIPVLEMQKAGYSQGSGIDQHFFTMAKKTNKKVMALETTEYQLNIFAELPPELQIKFLKYNLKSGKQNIEDIDKIVGYWKAGDGKKLDALMQGELKKFSKTVYQKLLVQRNKNWIPEIEAILKTSKIPMIVVGAGHLVGPDSVVALLKKDGYTLEQM